MRKIIIIGIIITSLFTESIDAWADDANNLKKRLDKISSFHAKFTQKTTDSSGDIIQEGQGDLWFRRPNQFNWHMIKPEENILISNGKDLWFYNPFIEQVTVTCLKSITSNTPFMLITNNKTSEWQKYNIKQIGDNFELTPKRDNDFNLKSIILNVSDNGSINQLVTVNYNNQRDVYHFEFQQDVLDKSKFIFIPPQNVKIDDQRN